MTTTGKGTGTTVTAGAASLVGSVVGHARASTAWGYGASLEASGSSAAMTLPLPARFAR
jgi:hypothetical protein